MEQQLKKENLEDYTVKSRRRKNSIVKSCIWLIVGLVVGIIIGIFISGNTLEKNNKDISEDLSESEVAQQYEDNTETEMQEDIKGTVEQMIEASGFLIETPFVNLYYPEKWKEQIRVEQLEGNVYYVQFFATVGDNEEVHIFDIAFGGEEGSTLGMINDENNESIPVNIISYDFEFGEEWTTDEINEMYTMLEDINYIMGMLSKQEGFMPIS